MAVVVVGCLGLGLVLWLIIPDELNLHVRTDETAPAELCDAYTPGGVSPIDWFDSDGSSGLSFEQLGEIAVALGVRGGVDADARTIAEFIGTATSDQDPSNSVPGGLTPSVETALARFDTEVSERCASR